MKRAVILINPYLTEESEFYQPRRIAEELIRRGVAADILPNAWLARLGEDPLAGYDFCVYLDKDKYTPRLLEKRGMRLFNRAGAVEVCDDKMLTHLALEGIVPMPKTIAAPLLYKPQAAADLPEGIAYPVVVKECFGSFGQQVYLARGEKELLALREKLKLRPHLLQEFVAESAGRDLRVICIGGEVIACMLRTSEKDFRSNVALGGRGTPFSPDEKIRSIARRVSETLELDYCGIDLLFGNGGYLVCEVNSNAFFGGIEQVTSVNVAGAYAAHICREMYGV